MGSDPIDLLGIKDLGRLTQLNRVKDKADNIWSRGLVNHPDFTLHGIQHSETIIGTVAKLMRTLKDKVVFNDTERFLIGVSAYLHDIGMLIDLDGFIEERLEEALDIQGLKSEEQRRLVLINFTKSYGEEQYAQEFFDKENLAEPKHMRDAALIREMHHLFSDFLINRFKDHLDISEGHEYLFVAPISRGHRRSDLSRDEYNATDLDGEPIKPGVLAALIRIADELDYSSKRIPDIHFEMYEHRLLRDPNSLEHWIKHFYITSPGTVTKCIKVDPRGIVTPVFQIRGSVPREDLKDLLERHVEKSRGVIDSLSLRKRLEEVGVALPVIDTSGIKLRRYAKWVPGKVGREIESKGVQDFLRELKGHQVLSYMRQPTVAILDNPPDREQIARAIGYQRNCFEVTYDWLTKKTCEVSFVYEIEALEKLSFVTSMFKHEEPLSSIGRCRVCSRTPGYEVSCEPTIRRGAREIVYGVRISPPLEEHANPFKYVVTQRFRKLFALTREDLERKSTLRPGIAPAGTDAVYASIVIPSARLALRVIFPPHHNIKEGQCRVTMIDSSIDCPGEQKRIEESHFFKSRRRKEGNRLALELDVIEPRLFRTYGLVWAPIGS